MTPERLAAQPTTVQLAVQVWLNRRAELDRQQYEHQLQYPLRCVVCGGPAFMCPCAMSERRT